MARVSGGDRRQAARGRARWIKHGEFFVGLSSGLSWLASATGTPVVMISGFAHPTNEFDTPYRIINYHACNSCLETACATALITAFPLVPAAQGNAAAVRMRPGSTP